MADTVKLPTDPLYRSLFLRAISHSSSLGADSGECFRALQDAKPLSPTTWLVAWSSMASRLNEHAATLLSATPPQKYSAKLAYLRASNYHRTAFVPLWGHPLNEEIVLPSYRAMRANFESAAKLFEPPLTPLEIPFQDIRMRGYLASPGDTHRNGRLLLVIGGYDSPMEELYFFIGHHALNRGYSIIFFDGPGQGGTLLESGATLSHNYDEVLASVLDIAAKHGTWKQTVVMGLSLGGLLCLQAVAGPKTAARVHAVIADPAELNLIDAFRARLPFLRPSGLSCQMGRFGPAWLLNIILNHLAARANTTGWALRRGMLVHGCDSPMAYVRSLRGFDNEQILSTIQVPVLVMRAQNDEIANQAAEVFKKLVSSERKEFMLFSAEEGAAEHCETGARMLCGERVFAWLDRVLA